MSRVKGFETIADCELRASRCRVTTVTRAGRRPVKREQSKTARHSVLSVVEKPFTVRMAFTLAEVLIVLGIIGLIADMTIPTLFQNIDKQVTVTKVQKAYTEMYQAVRLSEIDNGPVSEWETTGPHSFETSEKFFNTYLKPYLRITKECEKGLGTNYVTECGASVSRHALNYGLANGVGLSITTNNNNTSFFFDTNGAKGPNTEGRDAFYFEINKNDGLVPANFKKGKTREEYINGIENGGIISCCKKNGCQFPRGTCAALLMIDNWKIKDDYPW